MNDFSERRTSYKKLWPRFALHLAVFTTARRYASAVLAVSCVRLYPSVRPSQAGIVSKRLDESSWFSAPVHLSHTVLFGYLQKLGYFPPELCAKLISPRQVDDVVNKIRQRSSLLTTPMRQSTSRGCLLHVGQLQCSNSVTSICCGFVVQLVSTIDKILTDIVRRAVRLQ